MGKCLKRKDGGYKGWGRLKPWNDKQAKRKTTYSQKSKVLYICPCSF